MQIIDNYDEVAENAKASVIALGNFDGVHKGHLGLIKQAVEIASRKDCPSAVMTFEPHPINVFKPEIKNYRLTDKDLKANLLEDLGIDFLYRIDFNKEFASITAKEFIEDILLNKLCASHIVTGYDYIFGHNKGGDTAMLEEYSKKLGFGYTKVEAIGDDARYSSTRVRNALKEANLSEAVAILGRNFKISGEVVKGDNRGKSIGFPTINIDMGEYIHPKCGVYAVSVLINGDSKAYQGVANLGVKPTFDGIEEVLEVHIFDFDKDVYGQQAEIEFLQYVREERKFESADELVEQIKQDCVTAKRYGTL